MQLTFIVVSMKDRGKLRICQSVFSGTTYFCIFSSPGLRFKFQTQASVQKSNCIQSNIKEYLDFKCNLIAIMLSHIFLNGLNLRKKKKGTNFRADLKLQFV